MISTTNVVKKILLASDTAQLAAAEGILNASAFARQIQPQVEELAKKPVKTGTITTSLYRLLDQFNFRNFKPKVVLSAMSIQPQVMSITYEKTGQLLSQIPPFAANFSENHESFFTFTQGPEEITIIADTELGHSLIEQFGSAKRVYQDLVALSVRFSERYLEVPNTLYTLMSRLAVKRVNVIEVVSTLTTLTFVVREREINRALEGLRE